MKDANEVDTQIENDLNTETELDDDSSTELEDSSTESDNDSDNDNDDSTTDDVDIGSMSDEEFMEYLNSSETKKQIKVKEEIDNGNNEESSTSKSGDDKRSESDSGRQRRLRGSETEQEKSGSDSSNKDDDRKDKHSDVDYKSTYEAIFKPFKANGTEITPRSVDDVVSLMQMGANYTKKMQAMAPVRKIYESLNKANISENDVNFLIDVYKGDKEAIKSLLEKHKVDPIDLDMDNTNYVPNNNLANDDDVEYSDLLDDIQNSLPKIQEIITKVWDKKSKEMLLKDPNLMRALHEEIEHGRFDDVQARLEIEKTFGRFKGKSDIEAYIELVTKTATEQQQAVSTKKSVSSTKEKSMTTNTPKSIPDKSKAALTKSVKQSSSGIKISPKDLFAMSDEEFLKLNLKDLVV